MTRRTIDGNICVHHNTRCGLINSQQNGSVMNRVVMVKVNHLRIKRHIIAIKCGMWPTRECFRVEV